MKLKLEFDSIKDDEKVSQFIPHRWYPMSLYRDFIHYYSSLVPIEELVVFTEANYFPSFFISLKVTSRSNGSPKDFSHFMIIDRPKDE